MVAEKTYAPAVTRRKGIGHSTNLFPAGTARADGHVVNKLCECKFGQFVCDEASVAMKEQRFFRDEETEAVPAKRVDRKGNQQDLVYALFLPYTDIFSHFIVCLKSKRVTSVVTLFLI